MIGLEEVKNQMLRIKSKVDTSLRQGTDLRKERLGLVLLGNPGTGLSFHILFPYKMSNSTRENHCCERLRKGPHRLASSPGRWLH